jgi:polysaccharide biosynthesis protein PslG
LYSRFASAITAVIKQEDPSAQVAAGSLTILDNLPSYATGAIPIPGKVFLQGMYDNGFYPDIVSVHPYADGNELPDDYAASYPANSFKDVETIRQVMLANGQDKPIWITEFGWKIWPGLSEDQQAQYLKKAFEMIRDQWSYVTTAIWFWDYDRVCRDWFSEANGYGLFRTDGTMRPAASAFQEFLTQ